MIGLKMYLVRETEEYKKWFAKQPLSEQARIHARISRIREFGHFGIAKKLDASLAELKWRNGLRIYFSLLQDNNGNTILLLLGGKKHSQEKDIKKSKSILRNLFGE